jgi:hypothetical protein
MNDATFMHTTAFNSVLKRIIKFCCSKSIKLKTNNVKSRVSLLINEAPLLVLETAGPYFIEYADHIKAHDEEFFINTDYSIHFNEDDDKEDKKNVLALIEIIKQIYKKCNAKERAFLNDAVDDLLISYCGFLSETRRESNETKM